MSSFLLGEKRVGTGSPCLIVAEVSANHHQSFDMAVSIIKEAKKAGADAIKIQTYTPDTLTIDCSKEWFQITSQNPWAGKSLYQLYGEAQTPWEWHGDLKRVAQEQGLEFFSTPFDATAVDFLERLEVPAYKIASFEIVDVPLLRKIGNTGKPVIVSTGMASLSEIEECVKTLRENGTRSIALLKCTSAYPALPHEMNLHTIPHLSTTFNVVGGLSDHTMGGCIAVAAAALGAKIIEKHFILSRSEGGPDSGFSMEPDEFSRMVSEIRQVEEALGEVSYKRTKDELNNLCFRRSLFVVQDMKKGEPFTEENVRSIRPGYGLAPRYLDDVLGKVSGMDISRGTPFSWDLINGKSSS